MVSSIWNGSGADSDSTSRSVASTSIAPVGRSGFSLPSGRIATVPVTRTQNSLRSAWDASAASPEWKTTWATPEASRRSMKITPP